MHILLPVFAEIFIKSIELPYMDGYATHGTRLMIVFAIQNFSEDII